MSDTSIQATIKIHRNRNGLFKKKPAIVLFDNRFIHFFPDDTKEYFIRPGSITLSINKKKHLTFRILSGDKKELVIKEAISDWRFFLKYGILFLLTLLLLFSVVTDIIEGKNNLGGIIGLACAFWVVSEVRHEYFYLEEQ